jgi:hypothetical protein
MGPTERDAPEGPAAEVEYLEPVGDDGEVVGWRPSSASSERVVAGGRRQARRHLGALVAALLAVGLVVTWVGDDRDRGDGGDRGATGDEPTGAAGDGTDSANPWTAWAAARLQLVRAGTFSYSGTVRAAEASSVWPGTRIADEVTVEGVVHLPLSITREVAVAPDGTAVETLTSGSGIWSRQAPDTALQDSAPWSAIGEEVMTITGPRRQDVAFSRFGVVLLIDALQDADRRRDAPRDDEGRRVVRATVPERWGGWGADLEEVIDVVGGAELALTLDDGDVVRLEMSAAPDRPAMTVDLAIARHGEELVTPPDLAEPIGATLPPGMLQAVGLGSLDASDLPATWAVTGAWDVSATVAIGLPACDREGPLLAVRYGDLAHDGEVPDGWLSLRVWGDACAPGEGPDVPPEPVDGQGHAVFRAGRFAGWTDAPIAPGSLSGFVTDGSTAIWFTTDLPHEDAAAAIASLVPADGTPEG